MGALKEASEFLGKNDVVFTATDKLRSLTTLSREEREYIKDTVPLRQKEFSTSRWCARKSLEKLDTNASPILTGTKGEPLWPKGIVGSIAHAKGIYCAAVGRESAYLSLGIDIEPVDRYIDDETFDLIANNVEIEWIKCAGRKKDVMKLLIFSAKECFFKLLYPLIKMNFSFEAASVFLPDSSSSNNFTLRLNKTLNYQFIKDYSHTGYYFFDDYWLLTFLYIRNDQASP